MTGLFPPPFAGRPSPAPSPTGPIFNVFILTSTLGPDEFYDVPQSNPFHDAIHTIAADGISAGCGNGDFCPNAAVSRAQMAVFLLKAEHGASYAPPPRRAPFSRTSPFPPSPPRGSNRSRPKSITAGLRRRSFSARRRQSRGPRWRFSCSRLPSAPPTFRRPPPEESFADVSSSSFAAPWIEDLAARGITSGCGGGNYCPSEFSTRAQMAVFLVRTFRP